VPLPETSNADRIFIRVLNPSSLDQYILRGRNVLGQRNGVRGEEMGYPGGKGGGTGCGAGGGGGG